MRPSDKHILKFMWRRKPTPVELREKIKAKREGEL
jgi:hypothetical protein